MEKVVEKVEAAATNMTEARALLEMVRAGLGTAYDLTGSVSKVVEAVTEAATATDKAATAAAAMLVLATATRHFEDTKRITKLVP